MSKNAAKKDAAPWMYDLLSRPVITEKATMGSEHGKVTFRVRPDADKKQLKEALETLFGVKVTKVNTINVPGKNKRFRGIKGKQSDFKKAVITLEEGQTIDFMAGVK